MIWSILRFVSWMERKKKYWYKGKLYDLIWLCGFFCLLKMPKDIMKMFKLCGKIICIYFVLDFIIMGKCVVYRTLKYSLQGTTQGNGLTGGVPPVRFSM